MLEVIDNFITDKQANELEKHALTCAYTRNQVSDAYTKITENLRFSHHFENDLFDATDVMQRVREELGAVELVEAYINASDCNTITLSHIDDISDDYITVIIYLNRQWKIDYQGATMFFDGFGSDEVTKTVFPKAKRAAIFSSNIWHMAGIPSHEAGVRYTLAIKLRRTKD
jgi:Rps23 Pro-64 3,4-dihydroxylase Tpa1-like proline 4-hydroxylase